MCVRTIHTVPTLCVYTLSLSTCVRIRYFPFEPWARFPFDSSFKHFVSAHREKNKKRAASVAVIDSLSKPRKKKRKLNPDEKLVFYGFECTAEGCPQDAEGDTEVERHDKFLQRVCVCKESTYNKSAKGHSLWVNFKTVHCQQFHKDQKNYPLTKVKDNKVAWNNGKIYS